VDNRWELVLGVLIGGGGLVLGLIVVAVLATVWTRKGLTAQQQAISHVEESVGLSRRSLELHERAVALTEEIIRNQREIIEELRRMHDQRTPESAIRA
jgi:hypothetical protein